MEPEIVGNRIKQLMQKKNITIETFSKKIGIDIQKLNDKLEGKEEFYIDEMKNIKEIFELDEKSSDELFFKENCEV